MVQPVPGCLRDHGARGNDWVDLSADLARVLDVAPGDTVVLHLREGSWQPRVRRVLAVRLGAEDRIVVGPARPVSDLGVYEQLVPSDALFDSDLTVDDLQALLARSPDGEAADVILRSDRERDVLDAAAFNQRALAAISAFAYAAVVALAAVESDALVRRNQAPLALLEVLGSQRRRTVLAVLAAETVSMVVGAGLGALVILSVSFRGLFAPAMPPGFGWPMAAAVAVAAVVYASIAGVVLRRRLARHGSLPLTAGGA